MSTWKTRKINYMKTVYGSKIEEFKGHNDDRGLYVNIYNMIIEALESIENEPHNFIIVALNRHISEKTACLDSIIENFNNK